MKLFKFATVYKRIFLAPFLWLLFIFLFLVTTPRLLVGLFFFGNPIINPITMAWSRLSLSLMKFAWSTLERILPDAWYGCNWFDCRPGGMIGKELVDELFLLLLMYLFIYPVVISLVTIKIWFKSNRP